MPKILVKRGTTAPGTSLDLGEFGFKYDTNELYIGKGSGNTPVRISTWKEYSTNYSVLVANTAETPSALSLGTNTVLGRLTGNLSALTGADIWSIINGQNANDIDANAKKIINVATPVNVNDVATKKYVDDLVSSGLTFHEAVIAIQNTPPGSPATGDRYWIGSSPTGAWSGHAYQIAVWNGSSWDFEAITKGDTAYVGDEGIFYFYDGTSLKKLYTGIGAHADTHKAGGSDPLDVKDLVDSTNSLLKNAFTAKGQILVGTASGSWVALSVGSNGQVLMADSSQSSGVKWGNVASTFLSLTDTPSSYSGYAGYLVSVKATADGLEFVSVIDGGTL